MSGSRTVLGRIVWRSLFPFPDRTMISFRLISISLTRSRHVVWKGDWAKAQLASCASVSELVFIDSLVFPNVRIARQCVDPNCCKLDDEFIFEVTPYAGIPAWTSNHDSLEGSQFVDRIVPFSNNRSGSGRTSAESQRDKESFYRRSTKGFRRLHSSIIAQNHFLLKPFRLAVHP
jgi:hypothetical protein